MNYTISKLGLSRAEFDEIMATPQKTFHDYATYYPVIRTMKLPIKMSCSMGLLPMIFYQKYLG